MKNKKVIHLIHTKYHNIMRALCGPYTDVRPIESVITDLPNYYSAGTFNAKKVTCKKCLNHPRYKEALDKIENPLFYWKDRT